MATEYFGWCKTNAVGTDGMLPPSVKHTTKRASKAALADAYAAFCALLARNVPHDGATAIFEISTRGYTERATFSGRPSAWRTARDGYSKTPAAGVWFLETGPEGLKDRIEAK